MQDNPFVKKEQSNTGKGNETTANPFNNKIEEKKIEEVKVEEVKVAEVESVKTEQNQINKNTNVVPVNNNINENTNLRAYHTDTPVNYDDVITFDTKIKLNVVEKFKMTKDQKAVVAFVLFDSQTGSPQVRQSYIYYDEASKTLFRAPKNKAVLMKVAQSKTALLTQYHAMLPSVLFNVEDFQ